MFYACVFFCAYIYISIYTRYTYVTPEKTQISSPEPWVPQPPPRPIVLHRGLHRRLSATRRLFHP